MDRNGGSPDAFEFYHLTGWFLTHLQEEGGPVKLASICNPWRANENDQSALVGGDPVVIYPEDTTIAVEDDPGYKAIQAQYPNLMFWKPGPTLESAAANAAGQSFVFRYRLLDGCHACPIRGYARIEFDFHPDGTYQGEKLLGVVPQ